VALANITLYVNQGDVERQMSIQGVNLRLDDDGDGYISKAEQAAMQDALVDASESCNFFLYPKYTPAMLATSNWVNRKAMLLASYRLCTRRNNPVPDNVAEDAAQAIEDMKSVADGARLIPGLPLRRNLCPTWDNTRCDPRYWFAVTRVETQSSSQQPTQLPVRTDWAESMTFEF
jgi:phage gp36-like protein